MLYYTLTGFFLFLFLSFKFTLTLNLAIYPPIHQLSPRFTLPITHHELGQCFLQKLQSTWLCCQCLASFLLPHLRTPHSTRAMSCLIPNYFTSPDRFRKLKTSFHDVPKRKTYSFGGLVKYLHRQNLLFQY